MDRRRRWDDTRMMMHTLMSSILASSQKAITETWVYKICIINFKNCMFVQQLQLSQYIKIDYIIIFFNKYEILKREINDHILKIKSHFIFLTYALKFQHFIFFTFFKLHILCIKGVCSQKFPRSTTQNWHIQKVIFS